MEDQPIKLTSEQKKALDLMLSGRNVFLTGKAGTGKSTVLEIFGERCKRENVFLAPTGIAAINIGGSTLHSFFQLKPSLQTPESIEELESKRRIELIRKVETIVIDEVSMVRSDVFDAIDQRLQEVTECDSPFGGKQVILVGDFFQLPPVVKSKTEAAYLQREHGGPYAFQTELWKDADFHCMCLQTIHRQQNDTLFISILNHLRYGELEPRDLMLDGQDEPVNVIEALTRLCVNRPQLSQKPVYLCTTNREADTLNQFHQSKLKGEEHVFRAVVRGRFPESDYPTPETLSLKVGARVMTLTNKRTANGEIEYVNGEVGIIEAIEDGDDAAVRVRLDRGATVSVQRTEWNKYEYALEVDSNSGCPVIRQHEVGSYMQLPLKLAYAMTVHKAQGLSLDSVEVKLGNGCFAPGQLYTALSRCRSIKNLRIDRPVHPADAIVDPAVVEFYREIENGPEPEREEKVTLTIPKEQEAAVRAFLAQLQNGNDAMSLAATLPSKECPQNRPALPEPDPPSVGKPRENKAEPIADTPEIALAETHIATDPDIDHLLVVYRNQNVDEKHEKATKRVNHVGFNKQDAPVLTELSEKYLAQGYLAEGELATVRRLIAKYRRQWT